MTESEGGVKELTDEQYAEIGGALYEKGWPSPMVGVGRGNIRLGRAAYEAVRPLVLAEALAEPAYREVNRALGEVKSPNVWDEPDYTRVRAIFANRLAALTAKPDPAVEAVAALMVKWPYGLDMSGTLALEIVAAVDKARA